MCEKPKIRQNNRKLSLGVFNMLFAWIRIGLLYISLAQGMYELLIWTQLAFDFRHQNLKSLDLVFWLKMAKRSYQAIRLHVFGYLTAMK